MTATVEEQDPQAVIGRLVVELGSSLGVLLIALGTRTGLWAALADGEPTAAAELSRRTGVHPALVREWCRAQAAGGLLAYDGTTDTFRMPAAVTGALLHGPGAALVDACTDMFCSLGAGFAEFTAAVRSGTGFGWHQHDAQFWHGSDALTRVSLPDELIGAALDQLGPVTAALQSGGSVLDVGCGYGTPTIAIARHFPSATVLGIDYHPESITTARSAADAAGVADRVRFDVAAASDLPAGGYDLVTFFDSVHDLGDPVGALVQAREALVPGGAVLLVEPLAADRVEDNLNPSGRMFYAVSTMICTPNAISQATGDGGAPLGTQAGPALLGETAAAAGFSQVRRVPLDAPLNLVLELRP